MDDKGVFRLEGLTEFEEHIPILFDKATSSIDMCTSLYPTFYSKEKVRNAIEGCVEKGIDFKILLDKQSNIPELVKELPWIFKLRKKHSNLKITRLDKDVHHIIIVDNKHYRLESSHTEIEGKRVGKRNIIKYNAEPKVIEPLKLIFEYYWENSEELPIPRIKEPTQNNGNY